MRYKFKEGPFLAESLLLINPSFELDLETATSSINYPDNLLLSVTKWDAFATLKSLFSASLFSISPIFELLEYV